MATQSIVRKQIRGFVIIWTAITFIMGLATFLAIYFTYNQELNPLVGDDSNRPITLGNSNRPANNEGAGSVVVVFASITPEPSHTPSPAPATATVAEVVQQAVVGENPTEEPLPTTTPTETPLPTATVTPLPVDDKRFQVGIQVEQSPDFNPDNQGNWFNSVSNDLGLTWVKQQVRWELMEPEQGEIDWAILDLVVPSAEKYGIKLMLSIVTAPDWAREPGVYTERHGPPADPQVYANFVAQIVERYPNSIHAIEVWNEMNIDREWTSIYGLSAQNYVKLLQVTHDTVKAIDPGIIIISGALSPTGLNDGIGAFDDFVYMDKLIAAGVLNYADCVGAHHNGYNVSPAYRYNEIPNDPSAIFRGPFDNPHHSWSFRSTLEGYANRIRAAGSDMNLCVTEFGWPVTEDLDGSPQGFEFARDNTLAEQEQWIPLAMSNMEEWDFVWLAFIWNFNYGPQAGWATNNDNVPYSLIGPGFTFRPAYDAIREWQTDHLIRMGQ